MTDTKSLQERLGERLELEPRAAAIMVDLSLLREAVCELDAQEKLLAEAREALGPFAHFIFQQSPSAPGINGDVIVTGPPYKRDDAILNSIITATHLIKARTLLTKLSEQS